jgi:predicted NUDIX family NTP pyrophosphohydrolase
MAKRSAGLLTYRRITGSPEVFLGHARGPYLEKRNLGIWSIPKGECRLGDDPFGATLREYEEETGFKANGNFFPLVELKQSKGTTVTAWAFKGDCDPGCLRSNLYSMECEVLVRLHNTSALYFSVTPRLQVNSVELTDTPRPLQ